MKIKGILIVGLIICVNNGKFYWLLFTSLGWGGTIVYSFSISITEEFDVEFNHYPNLHVIIQNTLLWDISNVI